MATTLATMYIVKRDGRQQSCQFDKIQSRISKLCYGLDQKVSPRRRRPKCTWTM